MVSPPILSDGPVGSLSRHWSSRRRAPRSQVRPAAARSRRRALAARLLRRRAPGRVRRRNVRLSIRLRCDRISVSHDPRSGQLKGQLTFVFSDVRCGPAPQSQTYQHSTQIQSKAPRTPTFLLCSSVPSLALPNRLPRRTCPTQLARRTYTLASSGDQRVREPRGSTTGGVTQERWDAEHQHASAHHGFRRSLFHRRRDSGALGR